MKVILLQDVAKIGKKYEIKNVSDGYALNLLIPKKLARLANAQALKEVELLKNKYVEKQQKVLQDISLVKDLEITISTKANEEGNLFAKIDSQIISETLKDQKAIDIDANLIILDKPIKKLGEYTIRVGTENSHSEFKLNIVNGEKD